jgi:hypothetical protein
MMGDRLSRVTATELNSAFASGQCVDGDASSGDAINTVVRQQPPTQQPGLSKRAAPPALRSWLALPRQTLWQRRGANAATYDAPEVIEAPLVERRLWPQAFACCHHETLDRAQLRAIGVYAALAEFPYQLDLAKLSATVEYADSERRGAWTPLNSEVAKAIATESGLTYDGRGFSDGNGGMKAYIFVDETNGKATLVFGGTSSTSIGGGSYNLQRLVWGARDQFNQWWANFQSVFGSQAPQSYTDAAKLLRAARERLSDYEWSTCGHSKGGAEAAFAAAMNSTSDGKVNAVCFCAPPLGAMLMNRLLAAYPEPGDLSRYAKQHISLINVQGDPVPGLDRVVNAAHIGTAYTFPATELSGPSLVKHAATWVSLAKGLLCHVDFRHQIISSVRAATENRTDEIDPPAMPQ